MTEQEKEKLRKSSFYSVIRMKYGNNIKSLIEYAKKLPDKEKRNRAARQIIEAMKILNPDIMQLDDYEKILWNHLAILADYELDIDYPYPIIQFSQYDAKPDPIDYPEQDIKFRHYGKLVERLIEQAIATEDERKRRYLIETILIQMKKNYLFYAHAGSYAKDEIIFRDFEKLSGGKLKVPHGFTLPHSKELLDKYSFPPEIEAERRRLKMQQKLNQRKR